MVFLLIGVFLFIFVVVYLTGVSLVIFNKIQEYRKGLMDSTEKKQWKWALILWSIVIVFWTIVIIKTS